MGSGLGYLLYKQPIKPITFLTLLLNYSDRYFITKGGKNRYVNLAAGLGSRFKDITKSTHKSLLDIHGLT